MSGGLFFFSFCLHCLETARSILFNQTRPCVSLGLLPVKFTSTVSSPLQVFQIIHTTLRVFFCKRQIQNAVMLVWGISLQFLPKESPAISFFAVTGRVPLPFYYRYPTGMVEASFGLFLGREDQYVFSIADAVFPRILTVGTGNYWAKRPGCTPGGLATKGVWGMEIVVRFTLNIG